MSSWSSVCQKLWNVMEIWRSSEKTILFFFRFWDTVYTVLCYGACSWPDSVSLSRTARTRLDRSKSSTGWSVATADLCSRTAHVVSTLRRIRTLNHSATMIHFGKQHHPASSSRHFLQSQHSSCVSLVELEFTAGGGGGGGGGGLAGGLAGGLGAAGAAAGGPTSFGRDTPDNSQQLCCCTILWRS